MKNPAALFKIKSAWDKFAANHPKFPLFMKTVLSNEIGEDCIIDIKVTDKDGKEVHTNLKLTQDDMELFESVKSLIG